MKFLTILLLMLSLVACNNKVDTQVPSEIKVDVPATTQTVNVVHTFALSVQMEQFFRSSCTAQTDAIQPPMPEPQRSQAIDACVSNSVQVFIQNLMTLLNNGYTNQTSQQ